MLTALGLTLTIVGCGRSADLELRSLECGGRLAFLLQSAQGEVQNVSSHSLRDIFAVVTFRSDDGSAVESMTKRIDGPLQPGEVSWFEVSTLLNPAFSTCEIAFTNEERRTIAHFGGWFERGERT
jgi:hypothetical protein